LRALRTSPPPLSIFPPPCQRQSGTRPSPLAPMARLVFWDPGPVFRLPHTSFLFKHSCPCQFFFSRSRLIDKLLFFFSFGHQGRGPPEPAPPSPGVPFWKPPRCPNFVLLPPLGSVLHTPFRSSASPVASSPFVIVGLYQFYRRCSQSA